MKDNLIDDERAKQEEAAQESMELKLERLGRKQKLLKKILYDINTNHHSFATIFRYGSSKHFDKVFQTDGRILKLPGQDQTAVDKIGATTHRSRLQLA